jgi:hypothetical protein
MSYKDSNNNFKTLSWWEKIRIRFIPIDVIAQSFPITRRIADILGRRRIWGEDLRRPDLRTRGITIRDMDSCNQHFWTVQDRMVTFLCLDFS